MQKIEDKFEVLEILKNELPHCFKRGEDKLPLAIGIHEDVCKHYEYDPRFDTKNLKRAIGIYCKGKKYRRATVAGASRIDINGKAVSTVKKEEEIYALKSLEARNKKNKEIQEL